MHQRTQPHPDAMRSSKLLLADQNMNPTIIIIDIAAQIHSQAILLDPVDLKIPKRLAVEASDDGERVPALEAGFEERFLVCQVALLAPGVRDARVVHPLVEVFCVRLAEGERGHGRHGGVGDALGAAQGGAEGAGAGLGARARRALVGDGLLGEGGDAEGEVFAQTRDVAGVEGFALARGFGPDGVPDVVGEDVLGRGWGIVSWEVGAGCEGSRCSRMGMGLTCCCGLVETSRCGSSHAWRTWS